MSEYISVEFLTKGPTATETFIEEYALDATDRLSESDSCESFMFAPARNPETGDRNVVTLMLEGDADELLDSERARWEALVTDGPAVDLNVGRPIDRARMEQRLGERGTALKSRLNRVSTEMARVVYDEFGDFGTFPAPVETFPDEERTLESPLGWWAVLHHLTVQLNYSLDEELDAFAYGIEHTLRNIAEFEGPSVADSRIDSLIAELEAKRDDLEDGRLES